jgi:integrase/recombinase XerC
LSTRQLERVTAQVGTEAGIPGLKPHDLRYTFAKRMETGASAADGQPVALSVIQRLLGHARAETTVRYLRSGWDELGAAVERM